MTRAGERTTPKEGTRKENKTLARLERCKAKLVAITIGGGGGSTLQAEHAS